MKEISLLITVPEDKADKITELLSTGAKLMDSEIKFREIPEDLEKFEALRQDIKRVEKILQNLMATGFEISTDRVEKLIKMRDKFIMEQLKKVVPKKEAKKIGKMKRIGLSPGAQTVLKNCEVLEKQNKSVNWAEYFELIGENPLKVKEGRKRSMCRFLKYLSQEGLLEKIGKRMIKTKDGLRRMVTDYKVK